MLSLVQPEDGRILENGDDVLDALAAILTALPEAAQAPLGTLPQPDKRLPPTVAKESPSGQSIRFTTRPRRTLDAQIAGIVTALTTSPESTTIAGPALGKDVWNAEARCLRKEGGI